MLKSGHRSKQLEWWCVPLEKRSPKKSWSKLASVEILQRLSQSQITEEKE
ncbi:hypothetical protein COCNU_scaffold003326G000040 [Cocos nucifera]|nr:hypothetical protein [Cocos nucifera]